MRFLTDLYLTADGCKKYIKYLDIWFVFACKIIFIRKKCYKIFVYFEVGEKYLKGNK